MGGELREMWWLSTFYSQLNKTYKENKGIKHKLKSFFSVKTSSPRLGAETGAIPR